jgi:hypothetical protein
VDVGTGDSHGQKHAHSITPSYMWYGMVWYVDTHVGNKTSRMSHAINDETNVFQSSSRNKVVIYVG